MIEADLQVRPVECAHEVIAGVDFVDVELAVKFGEPHGECLLASRMRISVVGANLPRTGADEPRKAIVGAAHVRFPNLPRVEVHVGDGLWYDSISVRNCKSPPLGARVDIVDSYVSARRWFVRNAPHEVIIASADVGLHVISEQIVPLTL